MKLNRKWLLVIALVLSMTMAISGTLAYLTDRDSEVNTFTIGDVSIDLNEDFVPDSELIPGVRIEKEATITNTGKNDAWVWMTVAVPAVLDDENTELGSANVLHWNMPGCFWNGYHNQDKYIQSGIKDGYLTEGSTGVADEDSWINDNKAVKETIDGIEYNVYTFKYVGAIVPGETTNIGLSKVFLDENLDIAPDGQWYIVEDGVATKVNWNSKTDGSPKVIVSAYAMQTEGFANVEAAYNAYRTQWGDNGTEYDGGTPTTPWNESADTAWYTNNTEASEYEIDTAAELAGLSELVNSEKVTFAGKTVKLTADVDLGSHLWVPVGQTGATEFKGVFDGGEHTISNLYVDSNAQTGGFYSSGLFGWIESHAQGITIKNVTVDGATIKGHHNVAVIAGYMEGDSVIENCHVKNATLSNTKANDDADGDKTGSIAGYVAGEVTIKDCTAVNVKIDSGRDAGQLIGASYATPVNCSASNVTVTDNGTGTGANIRNELVGRVLP